MKRELGYNFDHMRRVKELEQGSVERVIVTPPSKSNKSEANALLSLIFAKDSSNLPSGDLAIYVNPNANPDVRKFIMDNLMMDVSSVAAPKNSKIDDDTAFALVRQNDETLDAYMSRVNDFGRLNSDLVMNSVKQSEGAST